jgi:hypothetical protein
MAIADHNFIIADKDRQVLKFRIQMFGFSVTVPAIFIDEDEALRVMFELAEHHPKAAEVNQIYKVKGLLFVGED